MSFKQAISLILLLGCILSCKKNSKSTKENSNIWEYREYVSSFTQGIVSKESSIDIHLTKKVDKYDNDASLPKKLMTISPRIEGKLTLTNNTLSFIPNKKLQSNQLYSVSVDLDKLYDKFDINEPFKFQFQTIEDNFSVDIDAYQTAKEEEQKQVVYGHVLTSDVMSREEVKNLVSARQDNTNLPIEFEQTEEGKYFNFTVTDIERFDENSTIHIEWNGNPIGVENKGKETIQIPSKDEMTVIRARVQNQPEQVLQLNFSDEIDKKQNFEGLIKIDSEENEFTYSVSGNMLSVFPQKPISGDAKITIHEGIKSVDGKVAKTYFNTLAFEGAKPQIRLIKNGTILPNSKELKINFEAIGIQAIDVRVIKIFEENVLQFLQTNALHESYQLQRVGRPVSKKTILLDNKNPNSWKAYSLDLAPLIESDLGSIYHIELSFKQDYSIYNCGKEIETLTEETIIYDDSIDEEYWNNESYYDEYWSWETYNWNERDNPCHAGYYTENKAVRTNVLASNLGLIAKENENHHVLAVTTDLVTADAEPGVTVNFYNFQKQLIHTAISNALGFAKYEGKERIAFLEAENKEQKAFLHLADESSLPMSQFPVDGLETKKGLKGFIFGERGIWRPGDPLHLNFILNDIDNPVPENHPVKFTLTDPEGVVIDEQIKDSGINGFYRFTTKTAQSEKTGNYLAKVLVGGASFYKSIPIENIKPNRLKIDFSTDTNNRAYLSTKWLHGATAKNLKATVDATVRATNTTFKKFSGYTFDDPAADFSAEDVRIYEGRVNDQGTTTFSIDFGKKLNAPGKLRTTYITKVYEKGGNFSIDALSKDYSPYSSYVGLLTPESDDYYQQLDTDKDYRYQVATVDAQGNPIAVSNIEVEVYKVNFRWWWNESHENLSSYVSGNSKEAIYSTTVSTDQNGKGSFAFSINYPEWGRYLVRLKNPISGHYTGKTVYYDWPSWRGRSQGKGSDAPNILSFTTDKEEYEVGEKIKVNFPSATGGRALISVESGSKVIDAFWAVPDGEYTSVEIKSTPEMAPNAYINITYIQPHHNTLNDLPIRLYGVVPISVYDSKTKLQPTIKVKDELKPESNYSITVKEENGRPMTYTLAVVDEGLLDLTRFKTPNAWDDFFQKQALGVRSWDIYDDVIGAYGGRIDQVFAIGGGNAAEAAGAKKAQRFKPVVDFLGPFDLNSNGKKTHELSMPYYVGSVRVMVIAGNVMDNAYGSAEKTVAVKKPLMILGTLPRKISQTERIKLPVSVFAMDKSINQVDISVNTNELVEVSGSSTQQLYFSETGEKEALFELIAGNNTGIAKVDITARGGGETAKYTVEIDLTNPNTIETKITDLELAANASQTIDLAAFGVPGSNTATLQLSTIPYVDFAKRLHELIVYPHGCIEQITSSVFPQLYLQDISDVSEAEANEIQNNVKDAIYRLKNYQAANGGFNYWPGGSYVSDYVTTYVGHFLLEAEKKGYDVPTSLLSNWKQYQTLQSKKSQRIGNSNSQFNQAYRLYTLALAGNPNLAAMNRLRETSNLSSHARWRLAAAYAIAGQKNTAQKLINQLQDDFSKEDLQSVYGSPLRNKAMALETALLLENASLSKQFATDVGKDLAQNKWYSTQTTAYSLYALSKFIEQNGGKGFSVNTYINGKSDVINSTKSLALHEYNLDGDETVQFTNNKDNTVYVRVVQKGLPPVGKENAYKSNLNLSVTYLDLQGNAIDITSLPQTTEFVAKVTIQNLTKNHVKHVALTQQLPSGWEIVNTRYTEIGTTQPSKANYIDIQDDRVNYYFDLNKNEKKTFTMLLNASFTGEYYLPGSMAEAMYDHDYYVKQNGKWIEVVE